MAYLASPMELIEFAGRKIYVKRDDQLQRFIDGQLIEGFNGNKARKFDYLLGQELNGIDRLVSHGSAQSNSLPVLAAIADAKAIKFDFYVDRIPSWLRQNPVGNYAKALSFNANVIESPFDVDAIKANNDHLWIPQGGHDESARQGIEVLADELIAWQQAMGFTQLNIMLPSGTGTTAVLLKQRFVLLDCPIEVYTCACVGNEDYLRKQFTQLVIESTMHPRIVCADKKYHFGRLYLEFYHLWQRLITETKIEFELLYDPLAWSIMLQHFTKRSSLFSAKIPLVYIHQGGIAGNVTMLNRYRRKLAVNLRQ